MIARIVGKLHSWSGLNRIEGGEIKRSGSLALVAALILIASWRDAAILFRYPVAAGFNGYYYVLQIDSLRNQGHFYFPTRTPLVFYALAGLRYLLGDSVLSIKIGTLFIHGLLCLGIFAIVVSLTRCCWPGLIAIGLAALAPLHSFMVAEYIKHAGALCLLVWGCWAAIQAFRTARPKWAILSVTLLIAALFSHKLALWTEVLVAGLALLSAGLTSPRLKTWQRLIVLTATLTMWITPFLLSLLSYSDTPLWLKRELSDSPRWPLQTFGLSEGFVLLIVSPLLLILLASSTRGGSSVYVRIGLGVVALWSLLITINPFLNSDPQLSTVSGRLGLLAYLQVAILLPAFFWLVVSKYRSRAPYIAAAIIPLLFLNLHAPGAPGLQDDYLRRRELLVSNLPLASDRLGKMPLVLAAHGDQFVVTSIIGVPSIQRLPERDNASTIFWLFDAFDCSRALTSAIMLQSYGRNLCTVW